MRDRLFDLLNYASAGRRTTMYKCIFCKKHPIKGLFRCEISGQVFKKECKGYTKTQLKHYADRKSQCPHFSASAFNRFYAWIDSH